MPGDRNRTFWNKGIPGFQYLRKRQKEPTAPLAYSLFDLSPRKNPVGDTKACLRRQQPLNLQRVKPS